MAAGVDSGARMSYDQCCFDLAEVFAKDEKSPLNGIEVDELAQSIQDGIEAYLEARNEREVSNVRNHR